MMKEPDTLNIWNLGIFELSLGTGVFILGVVFLSVGILNRDLPTALAGVAGIGSGATTFFIGVYNITS